MTFDDFVARKEAEAASATIPPLVTDVEDWAGVEEIGNAWSRRLFDGPFYQSRSPSADLPAANLVFVRSRDGNTVAKNPAALGGGIADAHLIYEGLSRVAADGVLAGAETVRGGRIVFSTWHPELVALRASLGLPRHPVQIVATLKGLSFDGILFNTPSLRVVLVTVGPCTDLMLTAIADRPWITTVQMPTAQDLPYAFRQMRAMGIARLSCVGGRTLARQLIAANLAQDLYLTTAPKDGGEPHTPLTDTPPDGDLVVRKHGTGADSGVVFEHSRLRALRRAGDDSPSRSGGQADSSSRSGGQARPTRPT